MSHDAEQDPVVRRAIDELQKMPQADAAAIRRVVAAAAAARVTPADGEPTLAAPRRSFRVWTVAGIAAAAAFVGFALSAQLRNRAHAPAIITYDAATGKTLPVGARPVAHSDADVVPIQRQFIFNNPKAGAVSIVGDFNDWTPGETRLVREPNSGLWSITLPLMPGRHMYGFMVDDSVFALDPHESKVHDRDLGSDVSVIIVGRP